MNGELLRPENLVASAVPVVATLGVRAVENGWSLSDQVALGCLASGALAIALPVGVKVVRWWRERQHDDWVKQVADENRIPERKQGIMFILAPFTNRREQIQAQRSVANPVKSQMDGWEQPDRSIMAEEKELNSRYQRK